MSWQLQAHTTLTPGQSQSAISTFFCEQTRGLYGPNQAAGAVSNWIAKIRSVVMGRRICAGLDLHKRDLALSINAVTAATLDLESEGMLDVFLLVVLPAIIFYASFKKYYNRYRPSDQIVEGQAYSVREHSRV